MSGVRPLSEHYDCHVCGGNGSPERPYKPECEAQWSHDILWLKDRRAAHIESMLEEQRARRPDIAYEAPPVLGPALRSIIHLGKDPHQRTIAFCSDGAAFVLIEKQDGKRRAYAWRHLPAVPGTPAYVEESDPSAPVAILNNIYRIVRSAMTQPLSPDLSPEQKETARRILLGDALEDVAVQLNQVRDGLPQ